MPFTKPTKSRGNTWNVREGKKALDAGFITDTRISKQVQESLRRTRLDITGLAFVTPWQSSMIAPEYFSNFCKDLTLNQILGALDQGLCEDDILFEIKDLSDLYALLYAYEIHGFFASGMKGLEKFLSFSPVSAEHALYKILADIETCGNKNGTRIGVAAQYGRENPPNGSKRVLKQDYKKGSDIKIATPEWLTILREKDFNDKVDSLKGEVIMAYPFTLKERK